MTTKGWNELHQDVTVSMSVDKYNQIFIVKMSDKSHAGRIAERSMPFQSLPLEQDELVLDDYLTSIYEQLYREILRQRG